MALVVGVSGGSSLVAGCAEERDPINRVQSGAVPKSFFLGADLEDFRDDPEFRTKSYNIDSAANTDNYAGTIGGASAVDRIRWEVTEEMLLARRSYQESPGADNRALPRKEVSPGKWEFPGKADGTIIAAYRIQSHFDVRRGYNPSTGEEQNTIEENQSDRPWHKREYMRVDWSKNLAESTSGDTSWVFGAGMSVTAVDYSASNESEKNADRPHFEVGNGYFDITNKYQLRPEPLPGIGIPECVLVGFYNGTTSFDCTPTEVKVRSSYIRLTGNEDFEPFEESRAARDIVGNWGNAGTSFNREYGGPPISAWDPQYGYTDAKTKTFYSIHNLWEKSHQQVACSNNEDADKDGTADECANDKTGYNGVGGSQCDVHIGKCTIPVRDRQVKTIAYWLNPEAPQDLTDEVSADGKTVTKPGALEEMTITWNQLLKTAVATRREVECRRTKEGTRDDCHAEFFEGSGPDSTEMVAFGGWGIQKTKEMPVDKGAPTFTTCHNPVRAYDLPLCGKVGEVGRLGDIRKNFAIYWPYASRAPYGGVATIGGDPLTGEMLGVTATIMMRSATAAAAQQRDVLQLAMGDQTLENFIEGAQPGRYAEFVKEGKVSEAFTKAKTPEEIASLVNNVNLPRIQAELGVSAASLKAMSRDERQLETAQMAAMRSPQTQNIAKVDAQVQTAIGKLDSTEYKHEIASRTLLKLAAESKDKSNWVYQAISSFSQHDPGKLQDVLDHYNAFLGSKGICFHDSINTAGAGSIYQPALAPYFKKLYGSGGSEQEKKERGVKIYRDLLRESVKGISFHEIGHSIGLRHNFSSSWDSMNYTPQYWQLRLNEGQATAPCAQPRSGGNDSCLGPRYLDPMTDDEQGLTPAEPRPGIEYFANTSTMEYQIERFGETVGAGTYDLHAMKTLYGRTLETFDQRQIKPEDQTLFAVKMLSQGIPSEMVYTTDKGFGVHYTTAAMKAKVFDAKRDCRPATDEEKESAKWRIVHGKICSPGPKNHLAYEDMQTSAISFQIGKQTAKVGVNGVRWTGTDETNTKLVRWSYRYGEDYSRGGYIHAKMFDSGADVYEITQNVIKRFDATYPWTYFRRQNKEFAWWGIAGGIANNTFARIRAYHWNTTTDLGRVTDPTELNDPDKSQPEVMAAADMFDFLQRVVLMPEPGSYGAGPDTERRTGLHPNAQPIYDLVASGADGVKTSIGTLGLVDGRFVQVDFDNDRGGSWDYFHYPTHTGFDEEKVLALRELVDTRPTLSTVSRDNALDGRDPYISFYTDTPHAVDRLLGGLLAEDWETIGPSMAADGKSHVVFSLIDKNPANLRRPAGNKGILFPNIGYQNELASGIYGLLFSRFSTDLTLANKMRVRVLGDTGFQIPAAERIDFVDPVSGQTYVARRFGTETIQGRAVEKGVASRMIQRANELLAVSYDNGNVIDEEKAATLRRYVGLLDAMRQVGNIFGGGPLGGGGGGNGDD